MYFIIKNLIIFVYIYLKKTRNWKKTFKIKCVDLHNLCFLAVKLKKNKFRIEIICITYVYY